MKIVNKIICKLIGHDTLAKSKRKRYEKMAITIIGINGYSSICRRCGEDTQLFYFSGGIKEL